MTRNANSPSDGARAKLLQAAAAVIRVRGYAATSVDSLCAAAGVTKGAFFHHFPNKDALAVAALDSWSDLSRMRVAAESYHRFEDPLDRVLGYIDYRIAMLHGAVINLSCLAGTIVSETYQTHPEIRRAAADCMGGHGDDTLLSDLSEAMHRYRLQGAWTAASLDMHIQAVLQGAILLAKAKNSARAAEECVGHLRRYIELLFRQPAPKSGVRRKKKDGQGDGGAPRNLRRRRQA
jgi:TetR/AcrR family transcriptional regulator, transcriptional repressor for nem operon